MNSGTAIIGAIFVAICMLPFIFMLSGRKKREKHLVKSISDLANNHHCKISMQDISEEFVIGLDESKNQLFFFKKTADKEIAQHVNLADIKSCKAMKMGNTTGSKEDQYRSLDKLELNFSFLDKKNPDLSFLFYNSEDNFGLNGEVQLIEKWANIVNDKLKKL